MKKNVAIVGATGVVGQEMLDILSERNFPTRELTLLTSAKSAGQTVVYEDVELTVQELTKDSFVGVDIALFSAGGDISKKYAQYAVDAGTVVIDNSSAFRLDSKRSTGCA